MMNQAIESMLTRYNCQTPLEYKNALKEIMQEISLLGLSRQNFFDKAAFYGGTAIRIAHGLNRFSEDLDFTLIKNDKDFKIESYLEGIKDEFAFYGLNLVAEKKDKKISTSIDSAFLKTNTLESLLTINGIKNPKSGINKNDLIKIKLEVDTIPSFPNGPFETKFLNLPIPFSYQILTLPALFAGKLHALLCREFKSGRVKGRDYYDYIWYKTKNIEPDLHYLKGKLVQTGHWEADKELTESDLKELLTYKIESTDWIQASRDVAPFVRDPRELEIWSSDFFKSLIE